MFTKRWLQSVLIASAIGLAGSSLGSAQTIGDADTQEINRFRLTEPALAKYGNATRALASVLAENPPGCDDTSDESLGGMAARLDAIPGARAALGTAGLTSREFIVFGIAMFQAGMGAWAVSEGGGQLPPDVSAENVAFFQAHEAEIQALSGLLPESDCDGGEDEGDWDDSGEWEQGDDSESDG